MHAFIEGLGILPEGSLNPINPKLLELWVEVVRLPIETAREPDSSKAALGSGSQGSGFRVSGVGFGF